MPNLPSSKKLPKGVWTLSSSSLFNDIASDAIYPILPLFLTSVLGAGPVSIGLIEGIAEATASLLKYFAGAWSDKFENKKHPVWIGYAISGILKPLLGTVTSWSQVLMIRFSDRIGKGIRGAPRDAWLSSFTTKEDYPRVYGFHRGMDHVGAFIGPILASLYLYFNPGNYRALFLLTIIPGLISVVMVLVTKEEKKVISEEDRKRKIGIIASWNALDPILKKYFVIIFIFALGNSADAFLILRLKEAKIPEVWIPLLWAALHVVRLFSSFLSHHLVYKIQEKGSILTAWIIYVLCYLGMGWMENSCLIVFIFLFYGIFTGLSEGPERALVAKLSGENKKGTAFGLYAMTLGLAPLPASLAFGWIWNAFGFQYAFTLGAGFALLAALGLVGLNSAE